MGGIAEVQNVVKSVVSDVSRALSPDAAKVERDVQELIGKFGADKLRVSANAREQALKGAYSKGGPKVASALLDKVAEGLDQAPLPKDQIAAATRIAEGRFGPLDNLRFTRGFNPGEIRFSGEMYHIGMPARQQGTIDMQSGMISKAFVEPIGQPGQMTAQEYKTGLMQLKAGIAARGLEPRGYTLERTTVPGVLKYKFMPTPSTFEVGRLSLVTGKMTPVGR